MEQQLIFSNSVSAEIDAIVHRISPAGCIILADSNTAELVVPQIRDLSHTIARAPIIVIPPDDNNKNLDTLTHIWRSLDMHGATRRTLLINVGGGLVSDIGGFAAATFKRGIPYINIPTTLLAAVDASVGGKTGINFNGIKNLIGAFSEPLATIISSTFLSSLPQRQILSGYAEMIKHSLLEDHATFARTLAHNPIESTLHPDTFLSLIRESVLTKQRICSADLREAGIRKALNLGHTIGHAFEALAIHDRTPVPHGFAVAWGLICELILSNITLGFPSETIHTLAPFIAQNFGIMPLSCSRYPDLLKLMSHDKKNNAPGEISFTLLSGIGKPQIDITPHNDQITAALDIYRDLSGQ